jgi:hypothetical protein
MRKRGFESAGGKSVAVHDDVLEIASPEYSGEDASTRRMRNDYLMFALGGLSWTFKLMDAHAR